MSLVVRNRAPWKTKARYLFIGVLALAGGLGCKVQDLPPRKSFILGQSEASDLGADNGAVGGDALDASADTPYELGSDAVDSAEDVADDAAETVEDADVGVDSSDAALPECTAASECDDGNPCTADTCDPTSGCVHAGQDGACDDGDACTANDKCAAGACVPGAAIGCDDGNPCTDDVCDAKSGCQFANVSDNTGCDDDNACTTGDKCTAGMCGGAGKGCDDGNPCTADSCANNVCSYADTTAACSDGDTCTENDSCDGKGVCAGKAISCDDGQVCTDDVCAKGSGCSHPANTATCSDGNVCTVGDVCAAKSCKAGALVDADGDGYAPASCGGKDCDDGKPAVNPGKTESCATVGVDDNCDGKTDEGCLNAVGCGADGLGCGGGKGKCSSGHCLWTDAKGYKWTLVPAGTFWMGCNAAVDGGCNANEKPQHLVDMSAYWIGVYEVTVANYKACVAGSGAGCTAPVGTPDATWGVAGKEQHPVNYVNWMQSQAYCKWLGGDLSTEAQWEKAAKGGCEVYAGKDCKTAEPTYPWGNSAPVCGQQAVFSDTSGKTCGGSATTYAVGAGSPKGASPYGAYDMAGNVWEWTLDWFDGAFYGKAAASQKDAVNSASASDRVIRSGSFAYVAPSMRAGFRNVDPPSFAASSIGARCVRSDP